MNSIDICYRMALSVYIYVYICIYVYTCICIYKAVGNIGNRQYAGCIHHPMPPPASPPRGPAGGPPPGGLTARAAPCPNGLDGPGPGAVAMAIAQAICAPVSQCSTSALDNRSSAVVATCGSKRATRFVYWQQTICVAPQVPYDKPDFPYEKPAGKKHSGCPRCRGRLQMVPSF